MNKNPAKRTARSAPPNDRILRDIRARPGDVSLTFINAQGRRESIPLKPGFVTMLIRLLNGSAVSREEISMQEAANLLNVSRQFVATLLDQHRIESRLVGTTRRVYLDSLLAHKRKTERRSDQAMRELAAQAQELKLGYQTAEHRPRTKRGARSKA